ncbi:hypothetical protein QGM71_11935 [Virgibacillus sp. C22-A2]|uniref:Uncharacterized protein n=1 Tax=Virgibacillus tibetensis TaxID=3042313 RepID=A0ABU6KGI3_9BACI|nr:hypothetical protein [Virgibacillus sp. C22-A2]
MSIWVLIPIFILLISMTAGLLFFYIVSPLTKAERKKQIEEVASLLINFLLFIWVGKILLNLTVFFQDPLAILAYPSNSHAFYIAVLLSGLTVLYKCIRKQEKTFSTLFSFIPVFLVGSFVFEFIQLNLNKNPYTLVYLGLLVLLIVAFLLVQERIAPGKIAIIILSGWTAGQLFLAYVFPFVTVFGYLIAPWFLIVFYLVMTTLYVLKVNVSQ